MGKRRNQEEKKWRRERTLEILVSIIPDGKHN